MKDIFKPLIIGAFVAFTIYTLMNKFSFLDGLAMGGWKRVIFLLIFPFFLLYSYWKGSIYTSLESEEKILTRVIFFISIPVFYTCFYFGFNLIIR